MLLEDRKAQDTRLQGHEQQFLNETSRKHRIQNPHAKYKQLT